MDSVPRTQLLTKLLTLEMFTTEDLGDVDETMNINFICGLFNNAVSR
jgi:hypothetical protein